MRSRKNSGVSLGAKISRISGARNSPLSRIRIGLPPASRGANSATKNSNPINARPTSANRLRRNCRHTIAR